MARPIYKGGIPFFKPGVGVRGSGGSSTGNVVIGATLSGGGAPVNGTSGTYAGKAGVGSVYIDNLNGHLYVNQGSLASPTWIAMAEQGSGVLPSRSEKTVVLALNGTTIHSGAVGIVNPEGVDCIVSAIAVSVTTHATAANGLIDVGWTSVSISTASDNMADGLAVGSGVTVPVSYTTVDQAGANGKATKYWTAGTWITVSDDATASVAGFLGNLYIFYVIA